ncbi:hypothetical protein [Megavirus chiliensis]|uniref:Uncharacterized protein n=1 Tax=Megavirus chiliensis TaxID=1094892 RepID=G5CQL0_9VIRU|nr:hypothetical protein MegaChil _gp0039 [Megavirus chiliensis]AEQ33373.1 hypothetical protein [Megavirus chiliensis]
MSNLYVFNICGSFKIYKINNIKKLINYLKNNLDDLRPLFQSLELSNSSFLKDLPEIYEKIDDHDDDSDDENDCEYDSKLNLLEDNNWKKCKKIIKKNIFKKYNAKEIFNKLECKCVDGNVNPCLHVEKMTTDNIIDI